MRHLSKASVCLFTFLYWKACLILLSNKHLSYGTMIWENQLWEGTVFGWSMTILGQKCDILLRFKDNLDNCPDSYRLGSRESPIPACALMQGPQAFALCEGSRHITEI